MKNEITILYYSASNNDEIFEKKIIDNIKKLKGDLPVVSVTQKPVDFGKNICVGVRDCCYANQFRQIQIALRTIKTKYVLTTESDFLYPPEYFTFIPDGKSEIYRYDNVWVVNLNKYQNDNNAYFKNFSDGAQLIDREMWLKKITEILGEEEVWYKKEDNISLPHAFKTDIKASWTGNPAITFKTTSAVRNTTAIRKTFSPVKILPYWGDIADLKREMNHPPEKMKLSRNSRMATHLPLLVRIFDKSEGDVLEIGTGYFSTLVLTWLCSLRGRNLYSYENNKKWYDRAIKNSKELNHEIIYCSNWDEATFDQKYWGLVFIDHDPAERRIIDIERLKDKADYIVIHDTEPNLNNGKEPTIYNYEKIWHKFKYRHDDKTVVPWTSVVSNFKKLDNIV